MQRDWFHICFGSIYVLMFLVMFSAIGYRVVVIQPQVETFRQDCTNDGGYVLSARDMPTICVDKNIVKRCFRTCQ